MSLGFSRQILNMNEERFLGLTELQLSKRILQKRFQIICFPVLPEYTDSRISNIHFLKVRHFIKKLFYQENTTTKFLYSFKVLLLLKLLISVAFLVCHQSGNFNFYNDSITKAVRCRVKTIICANPFDKLGMRVKDPFLFWHHLLTLLKLTKVFKVLSNLG